MASREKGLRFSCLMGETPILATRTEVDFKRAVRALGRGRGQCQPGNSSVQGGTKVNLAELIYYWL